MDHVIDEVVDEKSAVVGGGVQDPYGEDRATEDQIVTPWSVTVARLDLAYIPLNLSYLQIFHKNCIFTDLHSKYLLFIIYRERM